MPSKRAPARPPYPVLVAAALLSVFTLTRLGLAVFVGRELVPLSLWPRLLATGLWFDLVVATAAVAPLMLYEAALPNSWRASPRHRVLRLAFLGCVLAGAFLVATSEATFWLEFSTRFNFIAVDYLVYRNEVVGNIWESYPVVWIFSALGAAAAGLVFLLKPWVAAADARPLSRRGRAAFAAAALVLPALGLSLAQEDQMEGSGNAYADELSGNGVFTFLSAARRNEIDYDKFYATVPQENADSTLKALGVKREPLTGSRGPDRLHPAADPLPFRRRPRNVVLISVESLSARYVGAYGSPEGLTPNLDRYAREGLMFERFYATGTRTVRGLEALSLAIPPVPGNAVVRRQGMEHLATLGGILGKAGFANLFLYGGFGYFDNMNAYFRANDYEVLDRRDFPKESVVFANVWGVADESLFDNTMAALDRKAAAGRRFLAHVMTTSNHRPYTFPEGRIPMPQGYRTGAVRYTDYALGRFIEAARSRPWFKDTLFVITADHCASAAGKTRLSVEGYHIPLVFYAPGMVKPGVYRDLVSQIDLPPTLVEVLGVSGDDRFFGHSFFRKGPRPERAFISNYQELGYLRRDVLTVLLPKRRVESFLIDPMTQAATPAPDDPELVGEAVAYYQTASRAFKSGALRLP